MISQCSNHITFSITKSSQSPQPLPPFQPPLVNLSFANMHNLPSSFTQRHSNTSSIGHPRPHFNQTPTRSPTIFKPTFSNLLHTPPPPQLVPYFHHSNSRTQPKTLPSALLQPTGWPHHQLLHLRTTGLALGSPLHGSHLLQQMTHSLCKV